MLLECTWQCYRIFRIIITYHLKSPRINCESGSKRYHMENIVILMGLWYMQRSSSYFLQVDFQPIYCFIDSHNHDNLAVHKKNDDEIMPRKEFIRFITNRIWNCIKSSLIVDAPHITGFITSHNIISVPLLPQKIWIRNIKRMYRFHIGVIARNCEIISIYDKQWVTRD